MSKLIDVIIPAYNAEFTIIDTLKSIERLNAKDFISVIITDDGSIDRTYDVISNYSNNSELDITLLKQRNMGEGAARNNGLKYSTSEYVIFLDSDDIFESFNIKKVIKELISNKYDMIIGSYICDTNHSQKKYILKNEIYSKEQLIIDICGRILPAGIGNTFYRNTIIKDYELYFGSYKYGADMEFVRRYVTKATYAKCIDDIIFRYNFNPNSVMNVKFNRNRLDAIKSVIDTIGYFEYNKLIVPSSLNIFLISEVRGASQSYVLSSDNKDMSFIDELLKKYLPSKIKLNDFINRKRFYWLFMNLFFYKFPKCYLFIYHAVFRNKK
ncbi:glycosyltransferase family 2 protein [Photobacterium damselae]|uniref:glycosyltransferase family 2 protein n=1 Tax=Photobacterium damselae TaxID=38293 RepID=UPI002542F53A